MSVVIDGERGTITIPAGALASLVTAAVELVARYGTILPEVAREVQEQVTDALTTMCGMVVDAVDIEVEEVE
ncbi:MAG: Asp23/Gls24 family envelope stress response protein [Gaiellaceae bacterium]